MLHIEAYVNIFRNSIFIWLNNIYIVYVFVIKKDYSVLRIIIFAILLLSFVINMLNLFFLITFLQDFIQNNFKKFNKKLPNGGGRQGPGGWKIAINVAKYAGVI